MASCRLMFLSRTDYCLECTVYENVRTCNLKLYDRADKRKRDRFKKAYVESSLKKNMNTNMLLVQKIQFN